MGNMLITQKVGAVSGALGRLYKVRVADERGICTAVTKLCLNFQALIQGRKAAETLTAHPLGRNESLWCRRGEHDANHTQKGGKAAGDG